MLGAPEVKWNKLIAIIISFAFVSFLQIIMQSRFGWSFDFALGFLITATFFLGFLELVFLLLISVVILSWQPGISVDLLLLFFLPLIFYGARYIFSWESWVANIVFNISGIIIFYASMGLKAFSDNWIFLVNDILGTVIFASLIFFVLEYAYRNDLA